MKNSYIFWVLLLLNVDIYSSTLQINLIAPDHSALPGIIVTLQSDNYFASDTTDSSGQAVFTHLPTGIRWQNIPLPEGFQLGANYANPVKNDLTRIPFALPEAAFISIAVYDVLGRKVTTLVKSTLPAGHYLTHWNGANHRGQPVAPGVYFYVMRTPRKILSRKLLLLQAISSVNRNHNRRARRQQHLEKPALQRKQLNRRTLRHNNHKPRHNLHRRARKLPLTLINPADTTTIKARAINEDKSKASYQITKKIPISKDTTITLNVVMYKYAQQAGLTPEQFKQFCYDVNFLPLRVSGMDFEGLKKPHLDSLYSFISKGTDYYGEFTTEEQDYIEMIERDSLFAHLQNPNHPIYKASYGERPDWNQRGIRIWEKASASAGTLDKD